MELKDITEANLKFRSYRYWSDWVDMGLFNYGGDGYLLQMSVSRFNGKKFRGVPLKKITNLAHPNYAEVSNGTSTG